MTLKARPVAVGTPSSYHRLCNVLYNQSHVREELNLGTGPETTSPRGEGSPPTLVSQWDTNSNITS